MGAHGPRTDPEALGRSATSTSEGALPRLDLGSSFLGDGDGCVELIVEAMDAGVRVGSLKLIGSSLAWGGQLVMISLEVNRRLGYARNQKCRIKLRSFYFQGEFDVQPFISMNVVCMPNVLELVTMSEECITEEKKGRPKKGTYVSSRNGHLGSIYHLVKNCHLPELFSFPSPESKTNQLEVKIAMLEAQLLSKYSMASNKRLKPSDE